MDLALISALIAGTLIFAVYAVLSRGIFRASEPFRQEALDLAEELMASPYLSDTQKSVMLRRLDDFHSVSTAWQVAFRAVVMAFTWWFRRGQQPNPFDGLPPDVARKFSRFMNFWMLGTLSNSFGATSVFVIAALVGTSFSSAGGWVAANFRGPSDHHNGHGGALGKI